MTYNLMHPMGLRHPVSGICTHTSDSDVCGVQCDVCESDVCESDVCESDVCECDVCESDVCECDVCVECVSDVCVESIITLTHNT